MLLPCDSHGGLPGLGSSGLFQPRPQPESRDQDVLQSTAAPGAESAEPRALLMPTSDQMGTGGKAEPPVHWAPMSAGWDLENVFVLVAPSWCWKRSGMFWRVLASGLKTVYLNN